MIEKLRKLIDYKLKERGYVKDKYEEGFCNGYIKGLQDVLNVLGHHYDPILEIIRKEKYNTLP